MKYLIFFGLCIAPTTVLGGLNLKDTAFGQFLLNERSIINSNNIQIELEKENPQTVKTLFETSYDHETPLQIIARRSQNEEEIIRSIGNIIVYMFQHDENERSLKSLISFIHKDSGFLDKYNSEQNYPKISMFLSELDTVMKKESHLKSSIKVTTDDIKKAVRPFVVFGLASSCVVGFCSGGPILEYAPMGMILGLAAGILVKTVFHIDRKNSIKNLKSCKQIFINNLQTL